mmetsp:Transcript_39932/g.104737  ORF Transcript_39932/g.104737 Transcript_39932/m.104737 type:complete len:202 (-) Transcript_39932:1671-2276(-)
MPVQALQTSPQAPLSAWPPSRDLPGRWPSDPGDAQNHPPADATRSPSRCARPEAQHACHATRRAWMTPPRHGRLPPRGASHEPDHASLSRPGQVPPCALPAYLRAEQLCPHPPAVLPLPPASGKTHPPLKPSQSEPCCVRRGGLRVSRQTSAAALLASQRSPTGAHQLRRAASGVPNRASPWKTSRALPTSLQGRWLTVKL